MEVSASLGTDRVGEVYDRNAHKKRGRSDWAFQVYAEGSSKDSYGGKGDGIEADPIGADSYMLGSASILADSPKFVVHSDKNLSKVKSKHGLHKAYVNSFSVSFVPGAGASYTLGYAQDRFGGSTYFHSIGGGVGFQVGAGIDVLEIIETPGSTPFTVDNLAGQGFEFNAGVGPIQFSRGGNLSKPEFEWKGETYTTQGGSVPIMSKSDFKDLRKILSANAGASYQWNQTYLLRRC